MNKVERTAPKAVASGEAGGPRRNQRGYEYFFLCGEPGTCGSELDCIPRGHVAQCF